MKKVGILTHYYNNYNYGGLLQAFALTYFLNDQGYIAEQITYDYFKNKINYQTINPKKYTISSILLKILNRLVYLLSRGRLNKRKLAISGFRESIKHTSYLYDDCSICQCNDIYDSFIVGSDQVWHPAFIKTAFFLEFVKEGKKRISYASSISVKDLSDDVLKEYQNKISKFDEVSLRESDFLKQLSILTGKSISLVADPVFLVSKKKWEEYIHPLFNNGYLFCYFLENNKSLKKIAKVIARQKRLKIVFIPHVSSFSITDSFWFKKKIWQAAPFDFVSLFYFADYVITDSFHGCAFSTIFEKQFLAVSREKHKEMDGRMVNLLRSINADSHFIANPKSFDEKEILSINPIDYSKNNLLKKNIEESIAFIKKALKSN